MRQYVQSFFRSDPGEVADAERHHGSWAAILVAGQIDSERHDGHPLRGDSEQPRHRWHVIVADGKKSIDLVHLLPDQVDCLLAIRLDETVQEQIFPLQRAGDRPLQRLPQWPGQADEQRVRQIHDVRHRFIREPLEQLVEFLSKHAAIAFEHRYRQVAQELRIGGERTAGKRADDRRRVEKAIDGMSDEPRHPAEQRNALL